MNAHNKLAVAIILGLASASAKAAPLINLHSTNPVDPNISLYDYDEATSSFEEAYLNFNMNVGRNRDDSQSYYNALLNIDAARVLSSPNRDLSIEFNGNGTASRGGSAGADKSDSYNFGTRITADTYFTPGSKGGFWFGDLAVKGDDSFENLDTRLSAGLGYGRVTNVTPMAKAIRLIEELRGRGALSAAPSKTTYQTIANIIDRESEYISKYGSKAKFYQRHWIGDIESALGAKLSAAGILGARDVLIDENISKRRYGWKVRGGLSYVGTNFSGLKNNPGVLLGAEYHVPVSNQMQFSNEAEILTTFDDTDSYTFGNEMSLTYEVDDRIDWENKLKTAFNHSDNDGDNITTNALSSSFYYELGNSLDLGLTALVSNTSGNDTVAVGQIEDGTDRSINFGVRYRLR